jgi:hypothetical protein
VEFAFGLKELDQGRQTTCDLILLVSSAARQCVGEYGATCLPRSVDDVATLWGQGGAYDASVVLTRRARYEARSHKPVNSFRRTGLADPHRFRNTADWHGFTAAEQE